MNSELAKDLKIAGFPMKVYQLGRRFFPREDAIGRPDAARTQGGTVTPYELEHHQQDSESGYDCPALSDLIGACEGRFSRLFVMKAIWFAESDRPELVAMGDTPEEAVARLWLALNKLDSSKIRPSTRAGAAAPM
jgi:hypothetical protein